MGCNECDRYNNRNRFDRYPYEREIGPYPPRPFAPPFYPESGWPYPAGPRHHRPYPHKPYPFRRDRRFY
ncbi:MAG: hypothetical protein QM644_17720 [Mobilitalea sp.]